MEEHLWARATSEGREREAIFFDVCFSEAFSWNRCDISAETPIYSLGETDFDCNKKRFASIIVFTSCLARESAYTIRSLLAKTRCSHCTIYTSVSPAAATGINYSISRKKQSGHQVDDTDYAALKELLGLPSIVITYFPLHTIHILASEPPDVQVGVLSAQSSRITQPISLSGLRAVRAAENAPDSREYRSVPDINASDLPGSVKHTLKSLAHDLAGSLVFDYGLDVSTSVHALGKTSSILGHNILPMVDHLAELRMNQSTSDGLQLHAALHPSTKSATPLQPAALILLDRTEDLATPISAGTASSQLTAPLAHRIVNTLNYCQYLHSGRDAGYGESKQQDPCTQIDVTLKAPLLEETSFCDAAELLGIRLPPSVAAEMSDTCGIATWNIPLSALSNLPLQLNPSLQYNVSSTAKDSRSSDHDNKLLQKIMAGTEEAGKGTLCADIKQRIVAENGQLPPNKKRGLGAEVLAFTQALISAPGASPASCPKAECTAGEEIAFAQYRGDYTPTGLGYNYSVCLRSQPLLSLGLAVIESMQRSSGKQFQLLCDWQCAYDTRTAREVELDQMARKFDDFDICIAHVMSYFLPGKAVVDAGSVNTDGQGQVLKTKSSTNKLTAGADKEAAPTAGPVDVVHILVQTIRLMSLFRQRTDRGSSNLGALEECVCDFVLRSSCLAELEYLCGLRFLSTAAVEEILQYRQCSSDLDAVLARQVEGAHSPQDLLEEQAVAKELSLKQLKSSARDQIHRTFQALVELQTQHAVQKQVLCAKPTSSTGALHSTLDLLASPGGASDTTLSLGLVGRIAQGYLTHRAELLHSQQLFTNNKTGSARGGEGDSGRVLNELFEFVESPLEKMKRAGLDLLSKGLGSLGFGFSSQVGSAVSTPHPSEQPVLVIFVLGGISYKEVGEVQQLLSAQNVQSNTRIILLSTRMLNAENVLHSFCL